MIKGFAAIEAAVHAFASCGTKLAYQFGVVGVAAGTLHGFFGKEFGFAELLFGIRGRNAEGF